MKKMEEGDPTTVSNALKFKGSHSRLCEAKRNYGVTLEKWLFFKGFGQESSLTLVVRKPSQEKGMPQTVTSELIEEPWQRLGGASTMPPCITQLLPKLFYFQKETN